MNRRRILQLLPVSTPAAALGSACKSNSALPLATARTPSWKTQLFSPLQTLTVEDAVERLIPETVTPGARSAGVGEFVETMLLNVYEVSHRQQFLAGVDRLNREAQKAHALDYPFCSAEQQTKLLQLVAAVPEEVSPMGPRLPAFYRMLHELTILGFCNSRLGATRVVGYEPVPGRYVGCE